VTTISVGGQLRVRSWTGTVTDLWQVSVRYDCRAESVDQARRVIAGLASCDPGQVSDLARTCPIFGRVEAGDPR
jgi:hypothetical protein